MKRKHKVQLAIAIIGAIIGGIIGGDLMGKPRKD